MGGHGVQGYTPRECGHVNVCTMVTRKERINKFFLSQSSPEASVYYVGIYGIAISGESINWWFNTDSADSLRGVLSNGVRLRL